MSGEGTLASPWWGAGLASPFVGVCVARVLMPIWHALPTPQGDASVPSSHPPRSRPYRYYSAFLTPAEDHYLCCGACCAGAGAGGGSGEVQNAQRVAAAGMLDRQYGQSRVGAGSAGFSCGL